MELNEVIKSRRKVLAISQLDLAEMAEVSLATVKDIERGKGNPSLSTVNKLLGVLGLEMDFKIRKTIL
ncbi:helix-turn-helix transcriptional regulator [Prevotella pectinovora]|jgi:predicted transcriptional regulator|uniref:helix-turn-helix transcriptional regulator n=1 Tax=Prevotella pectinovora TaxID=1602169 RepID=UPI0005B71095|nr:helix-turn-helix domain-containing protein [Prevotella pectinovora]KIP59304.1 transcriptional regulator [Prevotella pectinovora]KIP60298.1 transcriptional regulator [Prevotella pectinovora]MDY4779812.1 helix-turn-helix domain-containing protein [Prevotella pectinovora]